MQRHHGLLTSVLGLALAACGGDDSAHAEATGSTSASSTSASSTAAGTGGGGGGATGAGGGTGGEGGMDVPPPPPGIDFIDLPRAVAVSPDGSIALLEGFGAVELEDYFYDTVTKELVLKTSAGDPARDFATGLSGTGRISANHGVPVEAGLWTEAGGWVDLGSTHPAGCDQDIASAWDVSADGTVAVGLVWNGCKGEAFRWTDTGGPGTFTVLDAIGSSLGGNGAPTNRATKVSSDGAITVGFAENAPLDRSPAVWKADGTGILLDPAEADWPGEALSVSADGKVVAGTRGYDGFFWTEEGGMQSLGSLFGDPPGSPAYANAIGAGGALIFGAYGNPWMTVPTAFVWTEAEGMRPLTDIITGAGLTIPAGYLLLNVLGASTDGSVVVGTAYDADGNPETFVLRLPVSAYGL